VHFNEYKFEFGILISVFEVIAIAFKLLKSIDFHIFDKSKELLTFV
jgi:hypothetical protein